MDLSGEDRGGDTSHRPGMRERREKKGQLEGGEGGKRGMKGRVRGELVPPT